jgi:hypothetical protein
MGGWGMPGVGFGMGPGMGMGYERPVEETVVNNYYDSPGQERGEQQVHDSGGDGNTQFSDASWNDNSGAGFDSGSDNGSDNGSGFDDSGSFDSGGGDSGGF